MVRENMEGFMFPNGAVKDRPRHLESGKSYLLDVRDGKQMVPHLQVVEFLGYRPCAMEIIVNHQGKSKVVSRRDLFEIPPHQG